MAANGGQVQSDTPAYRILRAAYDAHHGHLTEVGPFRAFVASTNLNQDLLTLP